MRFTIAEVAEIVGGTVSARTDVTRVVDGAANDTRTMKAGQLFLALEGERDGHDFINQAMARNAGAFLCSRTDDREGAIVVEHVTAALDALARAARLRMPEAVIGITGSSGKTSTKDLVGAILARRGPRACSEKSFNNEIGVPLTLLNAPDDSWAGVIEMGARGIGHIAQLAALVRPTVGVVLNVGSAHLGMYEDGQLGIARAKGELVEALAQTGSAVLNADDPHVIAMRDRTRADILRFSMGGRTAEISAQNVVLDSSLRATFRLLTPWGDADVALGAAGMHQVANALAAAGACGAVGSSLAEIVEGLGEATLSPWRMELSVAPEGYQLLNDAYNANPDSMAAGLNALVKLPARRFIAVLGPMAELGDDAAAAHVDALAIATELGIEVIAVNADSYGTVPQKPGAIEHVADIAAAREALLRRGLGSGDAVLLKGSRVAGLERLAKLLLEPGISGNLS
jgi:UDP-N-acetylmuramoyl-tripeptide--D-alanyl-D-alanine ligase